MSRHFYFSVHKWYIANRTHFVNDISVEGFFFAFSSVFYLTSCAWLLFDHAQNNSIDSIAINFTTRSRRSLMTTCINQFIADGYLYADDKQFENVNMPKRKTILKMIENPFLDFFWFIQRENWSQVNTRRWTLQIFPSSFFCSSCERKMFFIERYNDDWIVVFLLWWHFGICQPLPE